MLGAIYRSTTELVIYVYLGSEGVWISCKRETFELVLGSMESTKGSVYLPTKMHKGRTLKFPLIRGPSAWTCPSRCMLSTASKAGPSLIIALLLFSMGMMMYNTSSSLALLTMVDEESWESSAHGEWSTQHSEALSGAAAEFQHHRRQLGGLARYLSISPAATAQGVELQLASTAPVIDHDQADSPRELLQVFRVPEDVLSANQLQPGRELEQIDRMEVKSRWPHLGFQQKMHGQVPNGPDPIHNR